jgi:ABC-type multidrug transport system permease subunit
MNLWIAYWNIMVKDMRTYYLKPPNVSWGLIFPLAWTGMFFIKSGSALEGIPLLLPGVVVSYALPLTYGADVLHGAVHGGHAMPFALDLFLLGAFCVGLFAMSLWNIQRKWIL